MKAFFQHLNHVIGLRHDLNKIKELDSLENRANGMLLQNSLLAYLGVEIEERNGVRNFVLTGEIADDKDLFARVSSTIQEITAKTNVNVVYGLEKRGNILIFHKPIRTLTDIAEHILRHYPELNELNIRLEEYPSSRFVVTGRIVDNKESFEKFKAAIEQITDETDMRVTYGLKKENGYLKF